MNRHIRKSAYNAGRMAAQERYRAINKKFAVGENPLEREQKLPVIMPTNQQQLEAMTKMLEDLYGKDATPQQKQAMELWKFQVAQGTVGDQIKFDFVRRFYFWLLGRGSDIDHKKTSWGRANVAVYNPEVSAYIDQFAKKRMEFAIQLSLLKSRIPETLLGYYLYFKYIVNGKLKVEKDKETGYSFYDISNEDFLQDWDLFKNVFEQQNYAGTRMKTHDSYSDIAAPLADPKFNFEGAVPFPATRKGVDRTGVSGTPASNYSLQPEDLEEKRVSQLDQSLHISREQQKLEASANKSEQNAQIEGTSVVRDQSDLGAGTMSSIAPEQVPGSFADSGFADPFTPQTPYPGKGKAEQDENDSDWERRVRGAQNNKTIATPKNMSGVLDKTEAAPSSARESLDSAAKRLAAYSPMLPDVATPFGVKGETREGGRDSSIMTPLRAAHTVAKLSVRRASQPETSSREIIDNAVLLEQQAASIVAQPLPDDASPAVKKARSETLAQLREARRALQIAAMEKMFEESRSDNNSAFVREYGEGGSISYGSINSSELRDVEAIDENINRRLFEAAQAEVDAAAHGSDAVDESGVSEAPDRSGNVSNLIADDDDDENPENNNNNASSSTTTASNASADKSDSQLLKEMQEQFSESSSSVATPPKGAKYSNAYLPHGAKWLAGKEGKVYEEPGKDFIVKLPSTRKEANERLQFSIDNPSVSVKAELVQVHGREGDTEGIRMPNLKNHVPLSQIDKRMLTGVEKKRLGEAMYNAFRQLKYASYGDVHNLNNIAVLRVPLPDGSSGFSVMFYEGGSATGYDKKKVPNSDAGARAYMMRFQSERKDEKGVWSIVQAFMNYYPNEHKELPKPAGGKMQMKKR